MEAFFLSFGVAVFMLFLSWVLFSIIMYAYIVRKDCLVWYDVQSNMQTIKKQCTVKMHEGKLLLVFISPFVWMLIFGILLGIFGIKIDLDIDYFTWSCMGIFGVVITYVLVFKK